MKLLFRPNGLAQKFLQHGDLANQDAFLDPNINSLPSADVDAFRYSFRYSFRSSFCYSFRFALLLCVQNTSLFVTLSFQACVVFHEVLSSLGDHFQNFRCFSKFFIGKQSGHLIGCQVFGMSQEPRPTVQPALHDT
ncbi:MAG: hypothetical protein ACKPJJ_32135, partial [Planctomycetaceae bacterium]